MSSRRQVRAATETLTATGTASASVIAARMLAFSDPTRTGSAWHQAEAQRMVQEKCDATGQGMLAAGMQMAMLPMRMLQVAMRPSSWTPSGAGQAWMDAAGLWMGVGTAALQPARRTAVRNRARLAGRTG